MVTKGDDSITSPILVMNLRGYQTEKWRITWHFRLIQQDSSAIFSEVLIIVKAWDGKDIYIYIHIYICPLVSRPDSISMVKYGNIIDWGWFVLCWKYWTTTFSPIVTNAFRHLNHLGSGNTEASCFFGCSKNFMSRRTSKKLPIFELPSGNQLVGGLDNFLFFHVLGIIIPTD